MMLTQLSPLIYNHSRGSSWYSYYSSKNRPSNSLACSSLNHRTINSGFYFKKRKEKRLIMWGRKAIQHYVWKLLKLILPVAPEPHYQSHSVHTCCRIVMFTEQDTCYPMWQVLVERPNSLWGQHLPIFILWRNRLVTRGLFSTKNQSWPMCHWETKYIWAHCSLFLIRTKL